MLFPRLFTDQLDTERAIQVLHRICDQSFASPSLIYSVLYYADREHLSKNASTLYGETYLAYHHAAVPSWANHVYMTLCMPPRDVTLYLELRRLFLINGEGWLINRDMSMRGDAGFSQAERDCIDSALLWYRSASPREIIISRRDAGWQATRVGQPIPQAEMQRSSWPSRISTDTRVPEPKKMVFADGRQYASVFSADESELGFSAA